MNGSSLRSATVHGIRLARKLPRNSQAASLYSSEGPVLSVLFFDVSVSRGLPLCVFLKNYKLLIFYFTTTESSKRSRGSCPTRTGSPRLCRSTPHPLSHDAHR